jgi:polyisoprenoid-binding protein YceI
MNSNKLYGMALVAAMITPALAGTLSVDPAKSWVHVDAKSTGHDFTGKLDKFTASVTGDNATLTPAEATLSWDFADLKTGDGDRDKEMLSWLDHGKNPGGSFKMTKTWKDGKGTSWAQGSLKIHGISKSVAFPLSVKKDGGHVSIGGEVWIDHQDFNLPVITKMVVMTVDPKLKISFHLEGAVK